MLYDQLTDPTSSDVVASIAELSKSTRGEIDRQRQHVRITARAKVTAQPGDSSQRHLRKVAGVSGDVSEGGCQVLFSQPLGVGDIYWLSFDRTVLDVDPRLARCVRCQIIREDAFEAGLKFLQPLVLPMTIAQTAADALA